MSYVRTQIVVVGVVIFSVLAGAGIALQQIFNESIEHRDYHDAFDLAVEKGSWFAKELDIAVMPLYSLAQFALEIDTFATLPQQIGEANATDSRPFRTTTDGRLDPHRNVSGVCDNGDVVAHFNRVAAAIRDNANVDRFIQTIQLAPHGVLCLMYPLNNTQDFDNGQFLDNTKAVGLDMLHFDASQEIVEETLQGESLVVAGPHTLTQCPTCGRYFVARLPIASETHTMEINGQSYPRYGFGTVLIHFDSVLTRSRLAESFAECGFEYQLARKETVLSATTGTYNDSRVELARSAKFGTKAREAFTSFRTMDQTQEWILTAQYDDPQQYTSIMLVLVILFAAVCAFLVGRILWHKQRHAAMKGLSMAHAAKVDVERNMTAYFAHELRNPLSAIDSALHVLTMENMPVHSRETLSSMQVCTAFMSSIMNNLLDVRKMEEGKLLLQANPFSLKQLANDCCRMALPTVRPGVELVVLTDSTRHDWVLGDVSRVQQVLTNLVSNSVKYTTTGSISIVVDWDGSLVRLECRDTGPGISTEFQQRMFDRSIPREGAPGSGLGLAMAQQMVTLMGGSIQCKSDPSLQPGTTIKVLLPLEVCSQSEAEALPTDLQPIDEPLSILLVDDIRMNRAMLKRRFQNGIAPNCQVTEAINGEEALVLCEDRTFDVVVMDYYMEETGGVMVGTDVIVAMRRLKMTSLIIGCSGNDLAAKFMAAGADLVWSKPLPSNAEIIHQIQQRTTPAMLCSSSYRS